MNGDSEFRVAAFGDSAMWGQGLARTERFAYLITEALASAAGKDPVIAWDRSRSGACINATRRERVSFANVFPEVFGNRPRTKRFVDGNDQGRASELYEELPATFPTVTWQVDNMPEDVGKSINVALVSGSGNDMGLHRLLDPDEFEGAFVTEWDGLIRRIAYDDVIALLERLRNRCPKAVIIYFGYFAPFSYSSKLKKMQAMARYFLDNDLEWFLNKVWTFKDVNSILLEMEARSVWAVGRAVYFQKMAVNTVNLDPPTRGPGVIFSPSGFAPENSVFGSAPLLHEDYSHPTVDVQQARREDECPRLENLNILAPLRQLVLQALTGNVNERHLESAARELDAPRSLINAIENLLALSPGERTGRRTLREERAVEVAVRAVAAEVGAEVKRIERALIASFLHPNAGGALRYAEVAVNRYTEHSELAAKIGRDEVRTPGPRPTGGNEPLGDMLARYGMRGAGESLLADIGQIWVDSIGVWVVTARNSDRLLVPNVYIVIDTKTVGQTSRRKYQLNMEYRVSFGRITRSR